MKIVLDTNVLVSGIFWRGVPHRILQGWHSKRFDLLISPDILNEYYRVAEELNSRHGLPEVKSLLDLITLNAYLVQPRKGPLPACSDPDDRKFLAAAITGKAAHIVTGDKALLRVGAYPGGTILAPRQFAEGL